MKVEKEGEEEGVEDEEEAPSVVVFTGLRTVHQPREKGAMVGL